MQQKMSIFSATLAACPEKFNKALKTGINSEWTHGYYKGNYRTTFSWGDSLMRYKRWMGPLLDPAPSDTSKKDLKTFSVVCNIFLPSDKDCLWSSGTAFTG